MRWFDPDDGATRIKIKFALLPIKIGKETRWLETVKILQRFTDYYKDWYDVRFLSDGGEE